MGKRMRLREAQRHAAAREFVARLEQHARTDSRPIVIERYAQFDATARSRVEAQRAFALRAPEDWRCRIKSRSPEKRLLDLVKFGFARYRVAPHLENLWLEDFIDDFVDSAQPISDRARRIRTVDLRGWYVVAAQGGSLYKRAAHPYLTKTETHHFLTAPAQITSTARAFWYAFARAQNDHVQVALNVAQTRLVEFSVASSFWKDVARFFALNPAPVAEMDDLIDFIRAAKAEDETFSLKGRTLATLRRRMDDWHRALRKEQAIVGGAWAGSPLPDFEYETGLEQRRAIWRFRQLKTGHDLFKEGQRMHHCVATYKHRCVTGEVSIWSLTSEFPIGQHNRGVTIELHRSGIVAQCRGFANRLPYSNELAMIRRWANDHGLSSFALPA
jgi:PcfJ-like protein